MGAKSVMYKVINKERADMEGYGQAFEVYDSDCERFFGGWYDAEYGSPVVTVTVQTKDVLAHSPMNALFKFREWLERGHDEKFLLQDTP